MDKSGMWRLTLRKVYDPGSDGKRFVAVVQDEEGVVRGVQIGGSKQGAISRATKNAAFYPMGSDPEDEVMYSDSCFGDFRSINPLEKAE